MKVIYLCSSIKHRSQGVFQSADLTNKFEETKRQATEVCSRGGDESKEMQNLNEDTNIVLMREMDDATDNR